MKSEYLSVITRTTAVLADYTEAGKKITLGFLFYDPLGVISLVEKVQFVVAHLSESGRPISAGYEVGEMGSLVLVMNPKIRLACDGRAFAIMGLPEKEEIMWVFFLSTDIRYASRSMRAIHSDLYNDSVFWDVLLGS